MELLKVIVFRPLAFEAGYLDKIEVIREEYQSWIRDNFGYEAKSLEHSYTMIEERVYYSFEFKSEADAAGFKLRWL